VIRLHDPIANNFSARILYPDGRICSRALYISIGLLAANPLLYYPLKQLLSANLESAIHHLEWTKMSAAKYITRRNSRPHGAAPFQA
jgi:hypothetical protein